MKAWKVYIARGKHRDPFVAWLKAESRSDAIAMAAEQFVLGAKDIDDQRERSALCGRASNFRASEIDPADLEVAP